MSTGNRVYSCIITIALFSTQTFAHLYRGRASLCPPAVYDQRSQHGGPQKWDQFCAVPVQCSFQTSVCEFSFNSSYCREHNQNMREWRCGFSYRISGVYTFLGWGDGLEWGSDISGEDNITQKSVRTVRGVLLFQNVI